MRDNRLFSVICMLCLAMLLNGSASAQEKKPACWGKIPEYKPFKPLPTYDLSKPNIKCDFAGEESGLFEYLHKKGKDADAALVVACCEKHAFQNCQSAFFSKFDGNTLALAAAEVGSLPALKYFVSAKTFKYNNREVTKRVFRTDDTWRMNRDTDVCDTAGRSELMHAIANDDLAMTEFLLGLGEDANIDKDGQKIVYSNPKRTAPHPEAECDFKYDARDYARWHKGEIDDKIITIVEEAWEKAGPPKEEFICTNFGTIAAAAKTHKNNNNKWIFNIQQDFDYAINTFKLDFRNLDNIFNRLLNNKRHGNVADKYLAIQEKQKAKSKNNPAGAPARQHI